MLNVKDFGAVGDGVADDTAAIDAVDSAACSGALGLDGKTVLGQEYVYFPPGTYRHNTGLWYRGAPWVGAGPQVTSLAYYGSTGCAVDAGGSDGARRMAKIQDLTLDGSHSSGTAYGLRLGYNMRSQLALERVRIVWYPLYGMYFAGPIWIMSFAGVTLNSNRLAAIGKDVGVADLNGIYWFNLVAEDNGDKNSGVPGLMDLDAACKSWAFYGGVWEGNKGLAEARFTDSDVSLHGVYIECGAPPDPAVDGLIFAGACRASLTGVRVVPAGTATGKAVRCIGTSVVAVDRLLFGGAWPTKLSVEDTAKVSLLSEGSGLDAISVASGATFARVTPKVIVLTDAATIAVDASKGSAFRVTLAGNRTMGAPTNPSPGQRITFTVFQDGTGGRTLGWNAVFKHAWSNTGNTLNKRSTIEYIYDGTNWNQVGAQSPYI